jgi:phage shock protein PspC (stress-responsive transcriptional regulator)
MSHLPPANDNDDPHVILARKIARVLSIVLVIGLLAYLVHAYVLPPPATTP